MNARQNPTTAPQLSRQDLDRLMGLVDRVADETRRNWNGDAGWDDLAAKLRVMQEAVTND